MYKASRRREYERIKQMEEQVAREKADEDYERKKEEARRRDEEKTSKNKKRREKMKARKGKKGEKEDEEMGEGDMGKEVEGVMKKKLGPAKLPLNGNDNEDNGGSGEEVVKGVEDIGVVIHDDD